MPEEISLLIAGKRFENWKNIDINLSLDSIDSFGFSTPFSENDLNFREVFQPFTYREVQVRLNDEPLINGLTIQRNPGMADKNLPLGGYSRPGVLNDLPVPPDKYPLEFKDQTLRQIATTLAGYYDVEIEMSGLPGAVFSPAVAPEPAEKVLSFLIKLAKKRAFLTSNTLSGKLNFFVPGKSSVITPLIQGEIPLQNVNVSYDEQNMFSSATGLGAAEAGRKSESFTIPIPVLKGVNRPFVYTVSEVQGTELQKTVEFKAGRLFADAIKISAEVSGWRGVNNQIWTPGDFVSLRSPNVFFYNETKLMIRNISFQRDASTETASLELVFPGTWSGELPEKMPWE